jgi:hypothetical protein
VGKRKTLSLGTYPTVSLANARIKTNAARIEIDGGIDPKPSQTGKETDHKAECRE